MRIAARALACLALLFPIVAGSAVASGAAVGGQEKQAVIVQLGDPRALAAVVAEERLRGGRVEHVYSRVFPGFAAELAPGRIASLAADPRVRSVVPDEVTEAAGQQVAPPWGLDRTDQRTSVLDGSYSYGATGRGVTVYVVDSGIRFSHQEFGGRARSGYDFVDGDADASDCNGHGTHVAGTIGGTTYGVAKEAELVSLRVWGCDGRGWMSDMVAAFDWVLGQSARPAVINVSGGGGAYSAMDEAVARTSAAGIPAVVAAMNNSADACTVSPARAPSAITVAATTSTDARASFSNFGACVDLFAPGSSVLSSTSGSDTASGYMSGTSMATPHVAGAVARHLQDDPDSTVAEMNALLQETATPAVVADSRSDNDGLLYMAPATAPGAPVSVVGSRDDAAGTATITWAPPASDGGSPVTGYRVARDGSDIGGGGPWSTTVSASTRSVTFHRLVPGSTYRLTVEAINAVGTGPAAEASVTMGGGLRTVTVTANADTMARQQAPTTASGAATSLLTDSDETSGNTTSRASSYLRFSVPTLATGESIALARLNLTVTDGSTNGPAVLATNTTWTESTLTWNSGQPAVLSSTPVGNFGSTGTGRISTTVSGVNPGQVSFKLNPEATDGLRFTSRETTTTANRPQLTLTIRTP